MKNMPGFTAEASVGPTIGVYRRSAVFGRSGIVEVSPMQGLSALRKLTQADLSEFLTLNPIIRCCQYSPRLGRFVCASRVQPIGYHCECIRTLDFPVIVCSPLVFAPV